MVGMTPDPSDHDKVAKATEAAASAMQPQTIPVNADVAPEAFVVVAPLPAVTHDDVTIQLLPGTLRIAARLRSAGPREYVLHEWDYGGFEREIALPAGFEGGLEASLVNGQLVVRVLRGPFSEQVAVHPHPNVREANGPS